MKICILAGGEGTRLFDQNQKHLPKQFCQFSFDTSLLIKTIKRFLKFFSLSDIIIITNKKYEAIVSAQLMQNFAQSAQTIPILYEISQKGTIVASKLLLSYLEKNHIDLNEIIFITQADHYIEDEKIFLKTVQKVEKNIKEKFVLLGAKIDFLSSDYGYFYHEKGDILDNASHFCEKPDLQFLKEKDLSSYLWNTGMFFAKFSIWKKYLDLLEKGSLETEIFEKLDSFDTLTLETKWRDIGSFKTLYEVSPKDKNQNVVIGNMTLKNVKNCFLMNESDKNLYLEGLEKKIVIHTEQNLFSKNLEILNKKENKNFQKKLLKETDFYKIWEYNVITKGKVFLSYDKKLIQMGNVLSGLFKVENKNEIYENFLIIEDVNLVNVSNANGIFLLIEKKYKS